ncbi:peptidoglycan DD-metalloendopeptidase family protein [Limosilactobacillus ingluviei]|uniref:peptidoglycan DD-metalloendopeptidase family protein n=1 Tax=Limosilactobacillus ingluviei TaxID=148604 RepID=UPI0024B87B8C|nr:peptidoglycan DD-metalloendopeptidase family protein [Limosilactobacillus ingluviei]
MGKPSQDMKCHFKMYKKGKLWLVAGITAASLFAGVHGAKADTTTQADQTADKVATTTGNANSSDDQTVLSAATASANVAVVTPAVSASAQVSAAPAVSASAQVASASQAVSAATAPASQQAAPVAMYKAAVETSAQAAAQSNAVTTSDATSANSSAAPTTKEVYSGGHWYLQDTTTNQYLNGWQSLSDNRVAYYDTTSNQMQYGEKNIDNQWYYFNLLGDVQTGWYKLPDGRQVYYDVKKGQNSVSGRGMLHGMQEVNGSYYYFNEGYGTQESGMKTVNGKTYYFAPQEVKNAEENVNGHWYYFGNDGTMQKGFVQLKDGRTVYYNNQGQMQYNEQKINGNWYHFDQVSGNMAKGWYTLKDGRTVYYDVKADGTGKGMLHGEQTLANGKTYYFDVNMGTEKTNYVLYADGKLQYFGKDGALVKNAKVGSVSADANGYLQLKDGENNVNGNWYLYDAKNNKLKTGWQTIIGNRTVYYDPSTAMMVHGEAFISGCWYYFAGDGNRATGFTKLPDGRTVYYNNQGQMQYGEQHVNNAWYFFDKGMGTMATGFTKLPDGRTVYYNNQGQMQYGWQTLNNKTYFFDKGTGAMYTGTHTIDGKTYTFDNNGVEEAWGWPFPSVGQGYFSGAQRFGVNAGGEFRLNGFHDGLDFGSVDHPGSTVHAIHAGTVTSVGYTAGLDWYVTVDTGEYLVVYQEAFSSRNQIAVKPGQQIGLGDTIGYRNTSHLHIGITRQKNFNVALANSFNNNGTWLNPLDIILNNR